MEQLKQYAEKDASNLGNNIEVYKTDKNGNVQLDDNKKPIEDKDATTTVQNVRQRFRMPIKTPGARLLAQATPFPTPIVM